MTAAAARLGVIEDGREQVPARTDLGNAELFVRQHRDRLRYVPERGAWLVWDGNRWPPATTGEPERAAKATARSLFEIVATIEDDDERQRAAKWAAASQAEPRIRALLALARTEPEVVVSEADLDRDPFLFSAANGTVDLRTGTLRPADPADLLTRGSSVAYDCDAACPRWLRFLAETFPDDPNKIAFVHRYFGYGLTGDTREQVLLMLWGPGCNGKSVLVNVQRRILGQYAVTAAFETFMHSRNDRGPRDDLARLHGARLVTASESGEDRRIEVATVKEITGGDTIAARHLYGRYFEFTPRFKLQLVTNHRPKVDADDAAVWRRIRLVTFEQSFEGREDHDLPAKLEAEQPAASRVTDREPPRRARSASGRSRSRGRP